MWWWGHQSCFVQWAGNRPLLRLRLFPHLQFLMLAQSELEALVKKAGKRISLDRSLFRGVAACYWGTSAEEVDYTLCFTAILSRGVAKLYASWITGSPASILKWVTM